MQWSAEHQQVNMRTTLGTEEAENNDENENLKALMMVYMMNLCQLVTKVEFESFPFSQEQ